MTPLTRIAVLLLASGMSLSAASKPTNVRIALPLTSANTVEVSWNDNSDDESGFEIQWSIYLLNNNDWQVLTTTRANQTIHSDFLLNVPQIIIRVRALSSTSGNSDWSTLVGAVFPSPITVAITSKRFYGGKVGTFLTAAAPSASTISGVTISGYTATDLPPGMTLNLTNGTISGTPLADGVFRPKLTVTGGGRSASTFVTFRIVPANSGPATFAAVPAPNLSGGTSATTINLTSFLRDPDTRQAVRLTTNLGNLDVILHETATPASYENFMNYVDDGDYSNVIFHRAAVTATSGVNVIQAGLLRPVTGGYQTVPTDPTVINEPGISNIRGTLAIAKQSGNANSGTSQWYFNTSSNTSLNSSSNNGGFTVFGRASTLSLPVMDAIQTLPRRTHSLPVDGSPLSLSDFPTVRIIPSGSSPAPQDLVQISTAARIEPLTHAITQNPVPNLLAATLSGQNLTLTSTTAFGGTPVTNFVTGIGVTSTDLDGNPLVTVLPVTLKGETFALWTSNNSFPGGANLPGDNPDFDPLTNVLEYAFNGNPAVTDPASRLPSGVSTPSGGLAIRFTHRKFAADLRYAVQQSVNLTSWTTIWETTDTFTDPLVIQKTDQGSTWQLTVASSPAAPTGPKTYLRVTVTASTLTPP